MEDVKTDEQGREYIKLEPTEDGYKSMNVMFKQSVERYEEQLLAIKELVDALEPVDNKRYYLVLATATSRPFNVGGERFYRSNVRDLTDEQGEFILEGLDRIKAGIEESITKLHESIQQLDAAGY